jgi:hypothetical protein
LAARFKRTDLVSAAIQQFNPQDFTGKPLPSGASIDSHALSSALGTIASMANRDHVQAQWAAGYDVVNRHLAVQLVNERSAFALQGAAGASMGAPAAVVQGVITAAPRRTSDPRAQRALGVAMTALEEMTAAAREQLRGLGAVVVPNSGTGLNCLIISLLQHATCTYTGDSGLLAEAQAIRERMQLGHGMLLPDDPHFVRVVDEINRRYPEARLNVTIAMAWEGGRFMPVNNNLDPANTNPVLLLQGSNHYEAVTMRARPDRDQQQQWLDAALRACPRDPKTEKSDIAYARRLKQHDHRLDNAAMARGSGATVGDIAKDPKINAPALSPEQQQWLDAALRACPRDPKTEKSDLAYARRLKQHDHRLDNAALARGSGAQVANIKQAAKKWSM